MSKEPSGWFNLARTQRTLGQSGAARESLQKALVARPNWLPAVAALVALDIEAHESDAAYARIEEFKKAEPRNPAALVLEGDVHNAIQRFAAAAASYEKAYELAPTVNVAIKDYRTRTAGNLPTPDAAARPMAHRAPGRSRSARRCSRTPRYVETTMRPPPNSTAGCSRPAPRTWSR